MTRSYPREAIQWDLESLTALAALDPPQATYFPKADSWVVKQNGHSFAVRPDQIVDAQWDDYDEGPDPMVEYERYLETRYSDQIAWEEQQERAAGALDYWEMKGI